MKKLITYLYVLIFISALSIHQVKKRLSAEISYQSIKAKILEEVYERDLNNLILYAKGQQHLIQKDSIARKQLSKLEYFLDQRHVKKVETHKPYYDWAFEADIIPSIAVDFEDFSSKDYVQLYMNSIDFLRRYFDLEPKSEFDKFKEVTAISPRKSYSTEDDLLREIAFAIPTCYFDNLQISYDDSELFYGLDSFPILLPENTKTIQVRITNKVTDEQGKFSYDMSKMD